MVSRPVVGLPLRDAMATGQTTETARESSQTGRAINRVLAGCDQTKQTAAASRTETDPTQYG